RGRTRGWWGSADPPPRRATMDWTRNQGPDNSPPRTGIGVTMCASQPDPAAATDTGGLPGICRAGAGSARPTVPRRGPHPRAGPPGYLSPFITSALAALPEPWRPERRRGRRAWLPLPPLPRGHP